MKYTLSLLVLSLLLIENTSFAQSLFQIQDLTYEGAFIIPSGPIGESDADYCMGAIEYNSTNHSLFLAGKDVDGSIAEFEIPTLVNSTDLSQLNIASNLQGFKNVLNLSADGNPQAIDRVTGMKLINDQLIINGVEFYDAPADNTHTTLVMDDPDDLLNSTINGYYELEGAAHFAGWISPLPTEWQTAFGSEYLGGESSRHPINTRLPIGVSAFGFDHSQVTGTPNGIIPTDQWMDYDLADPLYADYSNLQNANYNVLTSDPEPAAGGHTAADINLIVGNNDLWTELSSVAYGFIVPGTSTYFTVGSSGGHNSGIGYKASQSDGNLCGGPCAFDADDYYNYYWLWDVNDLLEVKNGSMNPYDVRPYDYGELNVPFQTDFFTDTPEFHPIVGGTYDESENLLYLSLYDGGATGQFGKNPVIVAYSLATSGIGVKATAILEGAYNANTDLMSTDLRANNLITLNQPFNNPPWNYNGAEAFSNSSAIPNNAVNWVLLEARSASNNNEIVEQKAALLLNDGSIVGVQNANSEVIFYELLSNESYYLSLKTTNHLAVLGSIPIQLPNTIPYNFTDINNISDGANQVRYMGNSKYALLAGDWNSDGMIDGSDFDDYLPYTVGIKQYLQSDFNLDAYVTVVDFNLYRRNLGVVGVAEIKY